jgi:hypothetical protein
MAEKKKLERFMLAVDDFSLWSKIEYISPSMPEGSKFDVDSDNNFMKRQLALFAERSSGTSTFRCKIGQSYNISQTLDDVKASLKTFADATKAWTNEKYFYVQPAPSAVFGADYFFSSYNLSAFSKHLFYKDIQRRVPHGGSDRSQTIYDFQSHGSANPDDFEALLVLFDKEFNRFRDFCQRQNFCVPVVRCTIELIGKKPVITQIRANSSLDFDDDSDVDGDGSGLIGSALVKALNLVCRLWNTIKSKPSPFALLDQEEEEEMPKRVPGLPKQLLDILHYTPKIDFKKAEFLNKWLNATLGMSARYGVGSIYLTNDGTEAYGQTIVTMSFAKT